MASAKPPTAMERQSKEQLKGNLGQKEAQIEKEKSSDLSHMGKKSSEADKKSGRLRPR
jgi:hypothetical protein